MKSDARGGLGKLSGRMSVRVIAGVKRGFLFTYLGRWQDKLGTIASKEIVPIFIDLDGNLLPPAETALLLNTPGLKRNAPSSLLTLYESRWQDLRQRAQNAANHYCAAQAATIAQERLPQLEILRQDVEVWQAARLRYVDRLLTQRFQRETEQLKLFEEKEERDRRRAREAAETRRLKDLNYQKMAIKIRREQREKEIAAMEQIIAVQPEAIGALVIVPAEEC